MALLQSPSNVLSLNVDFIGSKNTLGTLINIRFNVNDHAVSRLVENSNFMDVHFYSENAILLILKI